MVTSERKDFLGRLEGRKVDYSWSSCATKLGWVILEKGILHCQENMNRTD